MSISDRYNKLFQISWDQLHRDAKALARKLLEVGQFKGIVSITRGGMVPSAIIARELDIRLIETICVVSYDWQVQTAAGSKLIKDAFAVSDEGEGWLLIDDLVDTGSTAAFVKEKLPKATFATIYAKPTGKKFVDYFITEFSQDTWLLFPWDTEVQYAKPIVSKK